MFASEGQSLSYYFRERMSSQGEAPKRLRNLERVVYTRWREETEAADRSRPGGEPKYKVAPLSAASVSSRHKSVEHPAVQHTRETAK